jgi:GNAT superfamily N-acetyltransferase
MEELNFHPVSESKSIIIATSGPFQIERMECVGVDDFLSLIHISESLAEEYGPAAVLTANTIQKYFNRKGSLPFIARFRGEIIGYIIGVPLELLNQEPWARVDINFGGNNTLYTYAFVVQSKFKGNGYAKMLKRVYLNWTKKQKSILYITGHVKEGVSSKFTGDIRIIDRIDNWQGTGTTFEYYRRTIDPEQIYTSRNDPPLSSSS